MKLKTIMGALVALVTLAHTAIAQTLPIQSPDLVRQAGLKSVTHGVRAVYSAAMDWSYEFIEYRAEASGTSAEDVLHKLFLQPLRYRITNPDESITGYVWLYDKDGNMVFFGTADYTANTYAIEKPTYGIWQQYLPILSDVANAEVITLNDDNQTVNRDQLNVNEGRVMFPPWYAGAPNGKLVVQFKDGTTKVYDLANPVGQSPTQIETIGGQETYKINGHYVLMLGAGDSVKIVEVYDRPTALLDVGSAGQLTIDVVGLVQDNGVLLQERPDGMEVEVVGKDGTIVVPLNANGTTSVYFGAGQYRILRFNWKMFGQPNKLYVPNGDGFKG